MAILSLHDYHRSSMRNDGGDVHTQRDHLDQVNEQISRNIHAQYSRSATTQDQGTVGFLMRGLIVARDILVCQPTLKQRGSDAENPSRAQNVPDDRDRNQVGRRSDARYRRTYPMENGMTHHSPFAIPRTDSY